jgi:tRNA(Ile)-lysidine synthase
LAREREKLVLLPRATTLAPAWGEIHEAEVERIPVDSSFEIITGDRNIACLDAQKLQFPLRIRPWEAGDKFMPLGMAHYQKLSDFFNNHKLGRQAKDRIRLLCSGDDIVWIMGYRIDHRYRITEQTRSAIVLKYDGDTH